MTILNNDQQQQDGSVQYANVHVKSFLNLSLDDTAERVVHHDVLQFVDHGSELSLQRVLTGDLSLNYPILIRDTPESIGMALPQKTIMSKKKKTLHRWDSEDCLDSPSSVTVRDIADIVGHSLPVAVIDVSTQQELDGWTFTDLVDYFEDEERVMTVQTADSFHSSPNEYQQRQRRARKSTVPFEQKTKHRVLNQISLEVSKTALSDMVAAPALCRAVDWIDIAWPRRLREVNEYPLVQKYCLTSAAGCYTDFHIDFGGTSVWYHIVQGEKDFCLIKPTQVNQDKYEEWLCLKNQSEIFLPDMILCKEDIIRVQLKQGQTMIIPAGWIHAVFTPTDSLVFGGNFLHGFDISKQVDVYSIETRCKVPQRFRFPYFVPLQFYAAGMYYSKLQQGKATEREADGMRQIIRDLRLWWEGAAVTEHADLFGAVNDADRPGTTVWTAARYIARSHRCSTVPQFLDELQAQLDRVERDGMVPDPNVKPVKKLRLKLSTPPLAVPTSSSVITSSPHRSNSPTFKITLSNDTRRIAAPLPAHIGVARTKPREDLDSYVDTNHVKDEDWVPSTKSFGVVRAKPIAPLKNTGGDNKTCVPKKRKGLSSRERLLKKVR